MKKYLVAAVIVVSLLSGTTSMAQKWVANKYANRYKLDIPTAWIKKPRLMRALTHILPITLTPLQEMDFCTEGKSAYTVKIFIGKPKIQNELITTPIEYGGRFTYTHAFSYIFYAGLMLYDSLGKELLMLRLTDPTEAYTYRKEYIWTPKNLFNNFSMAVNDGTDLPPSMHYSTVSREAAGATGPTTHSAQQVLSTDFLLKICEEKVFDIQKILRSLSSLQ
jgi:hypothetical protein